MVFQRASEGDSGSRSDQERTALFDHDRIAARDGAKYPLHDALNQDAPTGEDRPSDVPLQNQRTGRANPKAVAYRQRPCRAQDNEPLEAGSGAAYDDLTDADRRRNRDRDLTRVDDGSVGSGR